jgi:hypothetical protein
MARMAEERGFLGRWSARKRAAREAESPVEPALEVVAEPVVAADAEPEIDPADLPSLESITSGVDVQAFLQRGVPKALRQAALRRLWAVDPKIRDFREVADYDWDFNAPGYGALLPGDDPKALAEKLFRAVHRQVVEVEPAPPSSPPVVDRDVEDAAAAEAPALPSPQPVTVAVSEVDRGAAEGEPSTAPRRRRHGTAAPR